MKGLGNQFKDPLNMILSVLVVLSLLGAWMYVKDTPGLDYYVAWAAADAVNNDTPNNIYKPESRYRLAVIYKNKADERQDNPRQKVIAKHRNSLPMTATPFMYWVTGLLVTGDYEQDLTTWQALSLFLLALSILVICRILNYPVATSMIVLLPVVIMMIPLHSELRVANVNSVQLGMIALILWLQSRSADTRYLFATGLAIGLLAMFKPNLAPIALLIAGGWAVRRQFSKLMVTLYGIATGAFFALLVSSWWMGKATIWWDWITVLRHTVGGSGPGRSAGNYSAMTQVSGGMDLNNQFVLALLFCLVCLVALWWGRRGASKPTDSRTIEDRETLENTGLIAMGCIVALLASSLVWIHYYVLAIPMIIFALRPWQSSESMNFWSVLMLRVLPVIALFCLLDTEIRTLLDGVIDRGTYWAYATMTSSVSLFVVGLWQFSYGIRDQCDLTDS
jgi:hypothetical protein